jgi:quinol monooxygenase YgiN
MVKRGLLVRFQAKSGREADVEAFLHSALPLVRSETETKAWFAIRFGRGEYGIFDAFPDEQGLNAHLTGPLAQELMARKDDLLERGPEIHKVDVLADKLPPGNPADLDTKGLLLTFKAKSGHEADVEQFLRDSKAMVDEEFSTTAWFAIHTDDGHYGIFDVFPDNGGRFSHLVGRVPRELAKHAFSLLGSMPEMEMLSVEAEKLAS